MTIATLPPDDPLRLESHNEVHARPLARIRLPALVMLVAVSNAGVSRDDELAHLRALPGHGHLTLADLSQSFLRLSLGVCTLKWERHTEYTRYSLVMPLPSDASVDTWRPDHMPPLPWTGDWLAGIPGQTVAAVRLALLQSSLEAPEDLMARAQTWWDGAAVVASQIGGGHSWALTDFKIQADGFERMLVLAPPGTSEARAGRISQRLLEVEIYRLMALRGLPVAKALGPLLSQAESELSAITARLDQKEASEQELLDRLIGLAATVERATAEHVFRFSATRAYHDLVTQRIGELREKAIPGIQTIGDFMRRRLSPAMATVASTEQRLASLSERVARTSALLRTRVDIVTEQQNQQLLEKLTRGQDLQLRLQSTVEGLSIAAISYYVVSLLLYGGKALKAAGLPLQPELAAGASIPLVLWAVWKTTRRIHDKLHQGH